MTAQPCTGDQASTLWPDISTSAMQIEVQRGCSKRHALCNRRIGYGEDKENL